MSNYFAAASKSSALAFVVLFVAASPCQADEFGLFSYLDRGESIVITDYPIDAVGPVVVPAEIQGKPVTEIWHFAFAHCTEITALDLPATLKEIGQEAFHGCTALLALRIPASVESLGDGLAAGCSSLTSVELPDGIAAIATNSFKGCTSLEEIELPSSITFLGADAFAGCDLLKAISLPFGLVTIYTGAFRGCGSLESVAIPESVTGIGLGVFRDCTNLVDIELPSGLSNLGDSAFQGCSRLRRATIPAGIELIGTATFEDCSSLEGVDLPNGLLEIGSGAFEGCSELRNLELPVTLRSIGPSAFRACANLIELRLPPSLTSIGGAAFSGCRQLHSIAIPRLVESIGGWVFLYCESLQGIEVDPGNQQYRSVAGVLFDAERTALLAYPGGRAGSYPIPFGVTAIRDHAFMGCQKLTAVTFPETVTEIGVDAFLGCTALSECYFAGDAPAAFWNGPFPLVPAGAISPDFAIFVTDEGLGFDRLPWENYPQVVIDTQRYRASVWLLNHGYPFSISLDSFPTPGANRLLMLYAFDAPTHAGGSLSWPIPVVDAISLSVTYQNDIPGIEYTPEASGDLQSWSNDKIAVREVGTDGLVTAAIPRTPRQQFLRLSIDYTGFGTVALASEPLEASFDSVPVGGTQGLGGSPGDELAWFSAGAAVVAEEAGFGNSPETPTRALVLTGGRINFTSQVIDITRVANETVVASVGFRTYETKGLDWEDEDRIHAWIEASEDGRHFWRLDHADIIPPITGNTVLTTNDPADPLSDDLKKLELPGGKYTTYTTAENPPIPEAVRFIRVHLVGEADFRKEWFFLDNLRVQAAEER